MKYKYVPVFISYDKVADKMNRFAAKGYEYDKEVIVAIRMKKVSETSDKQYKFIFDKSVSSLICVRANEFCTEKINKRKVKIDMVIIVILLLIDWNITLSPITLFFIYISYLSQIAYSRYYTVIISISQ